MTPNVKAITMLHGVLVVGAVLIAVVLIAIEASLGPLLGDAPEGGLIGSILGGVGLVAMVAAVLVLRPRVPERRSGQSVEDYWAEGEHRGRAMLVWVATEAGVHLAAVGFLLSGALLGLIATGVGLGVLFLTRPAALSPEP